MRPLGRSGVSRADLITPTGFTGLQQTKLRSPLAHNGFFNTSTMDTPRSILKRRWPEDL